MGSTDYCESWPVAYWDSQFETLAWSPDGAATLEISECTSTYCYPGIPMVFTTMDYTYDPGLNSYCETGPTPSSSPMPSVSSAPTSGCSSVLRGSERLFADKEPSFICSPNGEYRFGLGKNFELALWHGETKIWSAEPCCEATDIFLVMQLTDANLVLRGNVAGEGTKAVWTSGTANFDYSGARLVVKNYGQAIIEFNETEIWSTSTDRSESGSYTIPASPAPTPRPSCRSYTHKTLCKERGCRWKGNVCMKHRMRQMR